MNVQVFILCFIEITFKNVVVFLKNIHFLIFIHYLMNKYILEFD